MPSPISLRIAFALLMLLPLAGCNKMRVRVDNPLVGPPPPRDPDRVAALAAAESQSPASSTGELGTSLVSGEPQQPGVVLIGETVEQAPPQGISDLMTEVAARVNGKAVFVGQIVESYTPQIEAARAQFSEVEFRQAIAGLVQRDLDQHIDTVLLVDSLMSTLKEEQKEQVEAQIDAMFEERIAEMQKKLDAPSLANLELKLQAEGTSLASLRRRFGDSQIAGQAMAMAIERKIGDTPVISRQELLQEYRDSIEEFSQPAQVRWQQIWVSRTGSEQEALQRIQQAAAALQQGESFEEAVRQYSQGATASNDGLWDWTRPESLENQEIAELLRTLPVGQISQVIADRNSYQIIVVTERKAATITPFEDVQLQLSERLEAERREAAAREVLEELRRSAVIERYFE
jgi:parvulin-like peptidyl-prolyl isomerase